MAQERLMQAIGRIERALSRLEATDLRPPTSVADDGLADRHEKLRSEVKATLGDIDSLLSQVTN